MTSSNGPATPLPSPGDRPSAGRLAQPPSARYAPSAAAGRIATGGPGAAGSGGGGGGRGARGAAAGRRAAARALRPAIAAGIVTAAVLVVIGGVLAERTGLLAVAGIGGAALGLLAAGAAVSPDGVAPPAMTRRRATRVAVALAFATIAGAALGTWAYGRFEGGVMDPLAYLWETFGLSVPAQAIIAAIAAAWGAGAGPVRSSS